MSIKFVYWDLGELFIGIDRRYIAREYAKYSKKSEEEIFLMLTHQAPDNGLWDAIDWFDTGKDLECSDYDFYLRLAAALELDLAKLDFFEFRRIYSSFIFTKPETITLAKRLRGVRQGIISNLSRLHQSTLFNLIPRELFDIPIFSFVEQVTKPDPEIFWRALRAANVRPYEVIFHDDRQENLVAAAKLGIYVCPHYRDRPTTVNVASAEAMMRALGVAIV